MARDNRSRITEAQNTLSAIEGRVATLQPLTDKADGRFQDIQSHRNEATRLRTEIETTKQEANALLTEITQSKLKAFTAEGEIEELVSDAEISKETFDTHSKNLEEIEGKIKKFEEKIVEQLGRAASGALAISFEGRQEKVEKELERWRTMLYKTTGAFMIVVCILFIYSTFTKIDLQFIFKLFVSLPFIYAVWFSGKQYNKERFIVERYAFKAAQAKSLSAFSKTVKEMDESDEGQSATQQFVINSIEKIYIAPKLENSDEEFPIIKVAEKIVDIIKETVKLKL